MHKFFQSFIHSSNHTVILFVIYNSPLIFHSYMFYSSINSFMLSYGYSFFQQTSLSIHSFSKKVNYLFICLSIIENMLSYFHSFIYSFIQSSVIQSVGQSMILLIHSLIRRETRPEPVPITMNK